MKAAEDAIAAGIDPERIYQGSSGSYFVRNSERVSVRRLRCVCVCVGGRVGMGIEREDSGREGGRESLFQ